MKGSAAFEGHAVHNQGLLQTRLCKANSCWVGQLVANILASVIRLDKRIKLIFEHNKNQGIQAAQKQQLHEYTLTKSKQPNLNEIFKTVDGRQELSVGDTTESGCVVRLVCMGGH